MRAATTGSPDKYPGYRWVVMGLWLGCSVSGWMVVVNVGVLLPAISADLSLSPGRQGLLGSVAVWGNMGLAIPFSWWLSRYRPKLLTTANQLIATVCAYGQALAPSFAVLLVARLCLGLTLVAREPARAVLTQQWHPRHEIPLVSILGNLAFNIVVGGGLAITPFILAGLNDNWRSTYLTMAGLLTVLLVLWVILGRERAVPEVRRREEPRASGVLRGALGYRDLWMGAFGFFGATMAHGAFVSFYPTMMLDTFGVALHWSGAVLAIYLFVGAFAGFGVVYLATNRRMGKRVLQALGLIMAATFLAMTYTGSVPIMLVLSLINGLAWGFWPILFTVPFILPGIRPREVAVALAVNMSMTSGGNAVGPLVAGFLQEGLGDLQLTLRILSFAALSLMVAGIFISPATAALGSPSRGDAADPERGR